MSDIEDQNVVILNNFKTFFGIATRNYSKTKDLCKERDSTRIIKDEDVDFACLKNAEIQRKAMITVIFSHMTLESYINFYGIENFSRSHFKNYLDKLDIKSKWVIIPELVTGKQINTESEAFRFLGELISLRNRLVHEKTRHKRISELKESDWVTEAEATQALDTVRGMLQELKKVDSKIDIDWICEVEHDPYA